LVKEIIQSREWVSRVRDNKLNGDPRTLIILLIDREGRRQIVPTLCEEALEPLTMVTKRK